MAVLADDVGDLRDQRLQAVGEHRHLAGEGGAELLEVRDRAGDLLAVHRDQVAHLFGGGLEGGEQAADRRLRPPLAGE